MLWPESSNDRMEKITITIYLLCVYDYYSIVGPHEVQVYNEKYLKFIN